MTKHEVIQIVDNSVSSIFTKEDVITLLEKIQDKGNGELIEEIKTVINNHIDYIDPTDFVELDDVEYGISGGDTIEISSFTVEKTHFKNSLKELIDEALNELD